jgi:hypothetical protein
MNTYTSKSSEKNNQSAANTLVSKNAVLQLKDNRPQSIVQRKKNNTGLPDQLKSGIENLSGHSMDDVKVHYHSSKPAQLQAHAFAQGNQIHLASGQDKHLPHEAWHVVQQKQGRVKPTLQMKGKVNVNDDKSLEKEADVMGMKALQKKSNAPEKSVLPSGMTHPSEGTAQLSKMQKLKSGVTKKRVAAGGVMGAVTGIGLGLAFGSNPVGWISGILGAVAATTVLSYFNGVDPDINKLEGVALRLGMTSKQLIKHWKESAPAPTKIYDHTGTIPEVYTGDRKKSMVPPSIINGLHGTNTGRLDTIFQNLNNMNFSYSGVSINPEMGYMTKSGDCLTLANMFKLAADAAGITGVLVASKVEPQIVASRAIHGRTRLGNVDGKLCWYFDNHYWCTYMGNSYDLLFMTKKAVQSYGRTKKKKYYGCSYSVFSNGYCLIDSYEGQAQLKVHYQGQGLCKGSENEIRAHIKKIKDPKKKIPARH